MSEASCTYSRMFLPLSLVIDRLANVMSVFFIRQLWAFL